MPRNTHGRYLPVADLVRYLAEAERRGARYVFVSAAGTLVLTRGRTMTPRGVVGHVDVERGVCEVYEPEVESDDALSIHVAGRKGSHRVEPVVSARSTSGVGPSTGS